MLSPAISSSTGMFDGRTLAAHAEIVVRHAEPADSDGLHAIFTDPEVMNWLVEVPYLPAAHTRRQVEDAVSGRYMLVACGGGRIVGALGLGGYPAPRLRHVGRIGRSRCRAPPRGSASGPRSCARRSTSRTTG
jgi:hypothetical protein